MTIGSRLAARAMKLPAARYEVVQVERAIPVGMPDGVVLRADRWWSPSASRAPIVLIRTPYGTDTLDLWGRLFAERGYQAVIQSCRGTFASGGEFRPFRHEGEDGAATLLWASNQPWAAECPIAMFGPSYLGITQWAAACYSGASIDALAMQVTASDPHRSVMFPGGSFALESGAFWVDLLLHQGRGRAKQLWALATNTRRLSTAFSHLPLGTADVVALGERVPFYREWLQHEGPHDPWWDPVDFSTAAASLPAVTMVAGWYDLFLAGQIADYERIVAAGRSARLTVGPWTHMSPSLAAEGLRDALDFFAGQLDGGAPQSGDRAATGARLHVSGRDTWVDIPSWPPPSTVRTWFLDQWGQLGASPGEPGVDSYLYDPARPTPSCGGASLHPVRAGRRDQTDRERRSDLLLYTSPVLAEPLTVVGHGIVKLWLRSSTAHFDVFVRVCDVDPGGRSFNVCDGLLRVGTVESEVESDHALALEVPLWPTAHEFQVGHRVRLQVSSAAHPLYARNTNTGERLEDAFRLVPAYQEVFRSGARSSCLELPLASI